MDRCLSCGVLLSHVLIFFVLFLFSPFLSKQPFLSPPPYISLSRFLPHPTFSLRKILESKSSQVQSYGPSRYEVACEFNWCVVLPPCSLFSEGNLLSFLVYLPKQKPRKGTLYKSQSLKNQRLWIIKCNLVQLLLSV